MSPKNNNGLSFGNKIFLRQFVCPHRKKTKDKLLEFILFLKEFCIPFEKLQKLN
ncbi:hypothetical protein ADICYQ_5446 [Cyclobacterium qasimii M12-11B]|uniref:Uncharacterized protein n=1 Tax=Cyclobacterium qasimii M12-11B TaxID=641524 RepID=S7V5S3_9BACT|nr:hypothetical protein ADICYQ_5446 [Cyclobacterium qasimii M12-11B]